MAQPGDDAGQDGDDDDGEHHQRQILAHHRQVAEEVTGQHEQPDPEQAAGEAEGQKAGIGHVSDAGHEWREGAQDRQEAGEQNGLAAVAVVEVAGTVEVLAIEQPRVGVAEHAWSEVVADPVIGVVAAE